MIGHDAIAEDANGVEFERLIEDAKEGFVVAILLEERQAGAGAVESVVDVTAGGLASGAWHEDALSKTRRGCQEKRAASPFPLFLTPESYFNGA